MLSFLTVIRQIDEVFPSTSGTQDILGWTMGKEPEETLRIPREVSGRSKLLQSAVLHRAGEEELTLR